jgi:hypothetical protein
MIVTIRTITITMMNMIILTQVELIDSIEIGL